MNCVAVTTTTSVKAMVKWLNSENPPPTSGVSIVCLVFQQLTWKSNKQHLRKASPKPHVDISQNVSYAASCIVSSSRLIVTSCSGGIILSSKQKKTPTSSTSTTTTTAALCLTATEIHNLITEVHSSGSGFIST